MAKFYKQDTGILQPPQGFDKFHVTWSLDNVLCGFKEYFRINGHWPTYEEIAVTEYQPTVRSIQRSFGGLKKIREALGIELLDHRTGDTRRSVTEVILKQAWDDEGKMLDILEKRFGETFVHFQRAVRMSDYRINVDFLVFHKNGKFAVDVFFPKADKNHYINNIGAKLRVYKEFPYLVYLVITNPDISQLQLDNYLKTTQYKIKENIKLVRKEVFLNEILKYQPLNYPYQ